VLPILLPCAPSMPPPAPPLLPRCALYKEAFCSLLRSHDFNGSPMGSFQFHSWHSWLQWWAFSQTSLPKSKCLTLLTEDTQPWHLVNSQARNQRSKWYEFDMLNAFLFFAFEHKLTSSSLKVENCACWTIIEVVTRLISVIYHIVDWSFLSGQSALKHEFFFE